MRAEFIGLKPWEFGTEIIRCDLDERSIDLHNSSTVEWLALKCQAKPALEMVFHDERGVRYRLAFEEVLELGFEQDPADAGSQEWNPEEVETFFFIDYFEDEFDMSPLFKLYLINGTASFRARRVRLDRL
jgi:hypothetical protein